MKCNFILINYILSSSGYYKYIIESYYSVQKGFSEEILYVSFLCVLLQL